MTFDISKLETSISHFGDSITSLLLGLAHFVHAVAPVAATVGTAIGNPEVTAASDLAEEVSGIAEVSLASKPLNQAVSLGLKVDANTNTDIKVMP